MTNERKKNIRIGPWEICLTTCTLTRDGEEVKITPRNMDVLFYLAENAGTVVSPDELLDEFWPGSPSSDHAVHKAVAELRSVLGDSAQNPRYIRTIRKRGYALIADVAPVSQPGAPEHAARHTPATSTGNSARFAFRRYALGFAAVVATILIAAVLLRAQFVDGDDKVIRLSVLPFSNHDMNASDEFLAGGLTESLLNGLSKLSHLEVLSPGIQYPSDSATSLRELDQASDSDYVLRGSIQRAHDQLRITVRLVRAADGVQQYSDQFNMSTKNLFEIQDEIASNVVKALSIHLNEPERSQMLDWGTTNVMAYEKFLQGEFHNNQFSLKDFRQAIDFHLEATDLDPDFLNAYHGAATAANNLAVYSRTDRIDELSKLVARIDPIVSRLAPDSEVLASIREIRLRMTGNNQAQQEIHLREQILSGDFPEFAVAHYALFLIGARLYEEALALLEHARGAAPFEISPDELWSYRNLVHPPEQAIVSGKRQLQQRPFHIGFLGTVATNLALTGDIRQARLYLERQARVDTEGILAHHSNIIVDFFSGEISPDVESTWSRLTEDPDLYYNYGIQSFMLGDIDKGVEYWSKLQPMQLRRLFNVTHSSERFFPSHVLQDPRYHAILEQLGAGKTWQRTLMEGVMTMQEVTGVKLSEQARRVYEENRFMVRNDLWTESDWADLEANLHRHRLSHSDRQTSLPSATR